MQETLYIILYIDIYFYSNKMVYASISYLHRVIFVYCRFWP